MAGQVLVTLTLQKYSSKVTAIFDSDTRLKIIVDTDKDTLKKNVSSIGDIFDSDTFVISPSRSCLEK
jgi:hypothetical protein